MYYVKNDTDLTFTFGSADYGRIAYNARIIEDKEGNSTFKNETDILKDDFLFEYVNNKYRLIAYLGKNDRVVLPTDINGQSYVIDHMRGVINVGIPEGVTSIGDYAFYDCSSLTSVTFGGNGQLTSIGIYAFEYCSSLTSVEIPSSVTSIGWGAFEYCSKLTKVYYGGNLEEWAKISMEYGNNKLTEATRYYYSEEKPTMDGNYWHYDENGNVVEWGLI